MTWLKSVFLAQNCPALTSKKGYYTNRSGWNALVGPPGDKLCLPSAVNDHVSSVLLFDTTLKIDDTMSINRDKRRPLGLLLRPRLTAADVSRYFQTGS